MSATTEFEPGDHVQIGQGKVHWEVYSQWHLPKDIGGEQVILMQSPMSGRRRTELARYVTLIRRPEATDLAAGF